MTKIGFIGAGRMGSALVRGFIEEGLVSAGDVAVSDVSGERLAELGEFGVSAMRDNVELVNESDVIFLSVKPQNMEEVLKEIGGAAAGKLFVSIAAGVTTATIQKVLGNECRVIRVMPNTPAVVGELAAGYCLGDGATEEDAREVERLLGGLGVAIKVDDELMDAVTGLSGSGPAYIYYIIDALAKAGEQQGLARGDALKLAAKTAKGAAEMILSSGKTPEELVDMVCSPGGTTIEGMNVLKNSDLRKVLLEAVKAATEKSRELSK